MFTLVDAGTLVTGDVIEMGADVYVVQTVTVLVGQGRVTIKVGARFRPFTFGATFQIRKR